MTNFPVSRAMHNHGDQPTLGTVLELIHDDPTLSSRKRQDTASALRSFARAMGHSVETCPAHPGYINACLKTFTPMQAGFSIPHWRNVLYRTRAALKHAGLVQMPGRCREPLSSPWQELSRQLPSNRECFALSRFSRYCTVHGITPDSVDDAVLERFRTALTEQSLAKNPREAHRSACRHWNKAVASIPSWPRQRVSVPDYRCHYVLP